MEDCNLTREEVREVNRAELDRRTFAGCSLPVDATLGGPAVPELPVNVAFGLLNKEVESLSCDIRNLRDRLLSSVMQVRPEGDVVEYEDKSAEEPMRSPVANGLHTIIREVNDMRSDVMEILERLEV